jgi:amino acid adenylation domain-containing protein
MLTQRDLVARFDQLSETLQVVNLTDAAHPWSVQPDTNPHRADIGLTPEHLAYIIYTSGSTGLSKGVMVKHQSVMNLFFALKNSVYSTHQAGSLRVSVNGSMAFDTSVKQIIQLLGGHALDIVPEAVRRDGKALLQFVRDRNIEVFDCTPSQLHILLEAGLIHTNSNSRVENTGGSLKLVLVGGESIDNSMWERLAGSHIRFFNVYGPTECTVDASVCAVRPGIEPSIGGPIANTALYVLDGNLNPVPAGVAGELYIGGHGVARGYWNDPESTAQKFVADPFSSAPGARLYRTGDRVRRLSNGYLAFSGRTDDQVKVRGYRIELGEIEVRLAEHPSVNEAVVLAREDHAGGKRLVAYVTTRGLAEDGTAPSAIDIDSLRTHLSSLLPEYMVPAAYVHLEKLPLTPNGKVNRKALPAPDAGAYLTREYEPALSVAELTIARIWEAVLKLERVGRNDNFFELGGHSLMAITVIEHMREAGLIVNVRDLFASPTLKGLAEAAGRKGRETVVPPNLIPADCTAITPEMLPLIRLSQSDLDSIAATVPGGAANVQDIYPLAPLQEGFLFHHLLEKEGDVYLSATLLAAASREHFDRYLEALQRVVDRHDVLRTAFVWEGLPEPVQVVWRRTQMSVAEVRLDPAEGDIAEQLRARFNPLHYRLDVRQAPLWRLFIAEDAPNHRWVILELKHHLTGDNTTGRFLLSEVQAILQGEAERLAPPLPFRNFVAQARLGVSREEHEAFFTNMLRDVDEPTAPFGLTNVQGDGSQIVEGHHTVDAELTRRLRTQTRALGVTAASLCHLAWALVLARTSGRDDVVFGTVLFGRMQGGEVSERGLGIFINTLPVRIHAGDETVRASVRRTHELLTQLFRHEHASLTLVQRCSSVRAPAPLFTSLFNYRNQRQETTSPEDSTKTMIGLKFLGIQGRNNYPFTLAIDDFGEGMSLEVKVDRSVDPQQVCGLMHTALESLIKALESNPAKAVRSLDVLPAPVREQLIYGWNQTQAEYPQNQCVHLLFEEQVNRTPKFRAVISQGEALSYRELNRRANRLAHYLRKQGIRPDEPVAICMMRGVDMVVALLGIMKAGGAYVGLDSAYPDKRLRYMIEDAGVRIVLTQQSLAGKLRSSGARLVCMDDEEQQARIAEESERNPKPVTLRENLVYVIYTSGSTGKPKGVGIEHRQLVNYVNGILQDLKKLGLSEGSKYATVSTLSADLGNTAIYPSLVSGGELHVIGEDYVMDGRRLGEYFEREKIDCLKIVPSHLAGLRGAKGGEKVMPRKVLVVGGEASTWQWVQEWQAASPCVVMNHYGPTETTVGAVRFSVAKEVVEEGGIVPIGRPLGNVQLHVLDERMELVPVAVPGELYIGGAGVGRGYVNRAELTAERFVPDPFSGFGQRLYRTGDLVRRRKDGNVEFLGRIDQQVKVRGYRIELGEVEAVLREQVGVEQAAVVAVEGDNGSKRLVAYLIPSNSSESQIDVESLRARLSSLLPDYMAPAAYVLLNEFPLNANGKLDRKALPSPDGAYLRREYEAPLGEIETAMAAIWAEVLKLKRVGRNDNFFEIGGHSLLAMQLINRIRVALGIDVQLRDIFTANTIKDMATVLNVLASLNEVLSDAAVGNAAGRYL